MRLFGKIRCTKSDYYIVEATAEGGEEEAAGSGNEGGDGEAEDKDTN